MRFLFWPDNTILDIGYTDINFHSLCFKNCMLKQILSYHVMSFKDFLYERKKTQDWLTYSTIIRYTMTYLYHMLNGFDNVWIKNSIIKWLGRPRESH